MFLHYGKALAGTDIPFSDGCIVAPGDEPASIRAVSNRAHTISMPPTGKQRETPCWLPQSYLAIRGSRSEEVCVWTQCHAKNAAEGIGKERCCEIGVSKTHLGKVHALQVGLAHNEMREI